MKKNLLCIVLLFFLFAGLNAAVSHNDTERESTSVLFRDTISGSISQGSFIAFPSPFLKDIKIAYSINKRGKVELSIYNLLGQQIKMISSSIQTPGRYQFKWNGADRSGKSVSSGMYYVILRMNDEKQVIKIMKTK